MTSAQPLANAPAWPTWFISHGAPTTALDGGLAAQAWAALGVALRQGPVMPRAVVVVSPHTVAGAQAALFPPQGQRLKAWHDFYGFPAELYELQYSPPGDAPLAAALAQALSDAGLPTVTAERAEIDHGVWVPLRSLLPQADVPVVQLAMSRDWVQPRSGGASAGAEHAARVGAALAAVRAAGGLRDVLVVGSGSLTHNLRDLDRGAAENQITRPYVQPFREGLAGLLTGGGPAADGAARWPSLPGARQAHPTDEHLLPLFFAWAAAGPGARARRLHESTMGGALAMDLWEFSAAS
jgi:4,5-DOPA dioxygenase extradiol